MSPQTLEQTITEDDLQSLFDTEDLWAVIVWNDDVNTFAHVTKALIEILRHSTERAEHLTLQIHNTGRAVVAIRPKEEAVAAAEAFHRRTIQATIDKA